MAEAYILKATGGHWMVEIWEIGKPTECIAGLQSEAEAYEAASEASEFYYPEGLTFCIRRNASDL